jgi:Lamin Tail Domain
MSWKIFGRATAAALAITACAIPSAFAGVFITEFNSTSSVGNREFVEFTNTGSSAVDMTGWSEDDSGATANKAGHVLSAFGMLQPHESAIFTETTVADFQTFWFGSVAAAPAGLKIIGPYSNDNLSSSADAITLFDSSGTLVDRLDYPGTPAGGTASGVSRNPGSASALGILGVGKNSLWVNSTSGDSFGSFPAAGNPNLIGNPGLYPVPEPASVVLMILGAFGAATVGRRR